MFRRPGPRLILMAVILLFGVLAAACGGNGDSGDNADSGNGDENPAAASSSEAQMIFNDVGCAECHGDQGQGNGEDPQTELAGTRNIIQQFRTRVRNGRGSAMPAYATDQITDEQIQTIWKWLHDM